MTHQAFKPFQVLVAITLALAGATALAQTKVTRIIVPYAPGGPIDVTARLMAERVKDTLGTVIIDNKPGGGGNIGADAIAKAAPDGLTIGIAAVATHAINPWLYSKMPYNTLADFVPVSLTAAILLALVVHPSLPVHSVNELVTLARARPGQLNYASGGNGSAQHLPMEMLRVATAINLVHVPYKGLGPAFNDVLGGQVPVMFAGVSNVVPYMQSKRLRVIAVGSAKRTPALPEVPTVS